jgi:hypothetical protein
MTEPTDKDCDRDDAARYRFLRDSAVNQRGYTAWCVEGTSWMTCHPCMGRDLDRLIDRAMRRRAVEDAAIRSAALRNNVQGDERGD